MIGDEYGHIDIRLRVGAPPAVNITSETQLWAEDINQAIHYLQAMVRWSRMSEARKAEGETARLHAEQDWLNRANRKVEHAQKRAAREAERPYVCERCGKRYADCLAAQLEVTTGQDKT